MYRVIHAMLRYLMPRYFKWQYTGVEHLPETGPVIVVSNHVNYLDPLAMGAVSPRPLHFMAKEELFANPVVAWLLRKLGAFPIRRGRADRNAIRHALRILAAGRVLAMFPEGTRSRTGELQELQRGAALLALKSGAPIVPMRIIGAYEALAGGRMWPRRVPMAVHVGPPLHFDRHPRVDQEAVAAASDQIHRALASLGGPGAKYETARDDRLRSAAINNGFNGRKRYRTKQKNV